MGVQQLIAEFDSFLAMAKISQNFVKPVISDDALIIKNGWHVLLSGEATSNNTFSYPFSESDKQKSSF